MLLIFLDPKTWGWMIKFNCPLKWVGSTPIHPKPSWGFVFGLSKTPQEVFAWMSREAPLRLVFLGRDFWLRILLAWNNGRRLQGVYIVWQIQILDEAGDDRRWSDRDFFGWGTRWPSIPSCSMYGICTYIYNRLWTKSRYINLPYFQCLGLINSCFNWMMKQISTNGKWLSLSEIHVRTVCLEFQVYMNLFQGKPS